MCIALRIKQKTPIALWKSIAWSKAKNFDKGVALIFVSRYRDIVRNNSTLTTDFWINKNKVNILIYVFSLLLFGYSMMHEA